MIKINVYRSAGSWYAARWIDGEYDGCDELGCDDNASEAEAIAHAALMPLEGCTDDDPREVNRVADAVAS